LADDQIDANIPKQHVLSTTIRNGSLRAIAISVGFFGFDSPRVHIDFLRVNIASAADLRRPKCSRPLRAALVLLSHGGYSQEWRDECDGKDVFDSHGFSPAIYSKVPPAGYAPGALIFIKEA
jgi:hypothetical protein